MSAQIISSAQKAPGFSGDGGSPGGPPFCFSGPQMKGLKGSCRVPPRRANNATSAVPGQRPRPEGRQIIRSYLPVSPSSPVLPNVIFGQLRHGSQPGNPPAANGTRDRQQDRIAQRSCREEQSILIHSIPCYKELIVENGSLNGMKFFSNA
jgi:hypothetical protein